MADQGIQTSKLPIGESLSEGLTIFFRNFPAFLITALLIYLPILVISLIAGADVTGATYIMMTENPMAEVYLAGGAIAGLAVLGSVIMLFLPLILAGASTFGVAQHYRGERPQVGAMVRRGLGRAFHIFLITLITLLILAVPTIPVALVVGLGSGVLIAIVGVIAFVVGAYLFLGLVTAVPVTVVERLGPIASVKRSFALVRGNRWRVLGFFVLAVIAIMVAQLVVSAIAGLLVAAGGGLLAGILGWIISGLVGGLYAALVATLYFRLRNAKEGRSLSDLVSVFE